MPAMIMDNKLETNNWKQEGNRMTIRNEAKVKNPLIVAIREQLEHRALWMYLPATIARGDDSCQIRFVRREKKEN